jgi:hypothetical protein
MKLDRFKQLLSMLAPVVLTAVPGGEKIAPFVPVIVHGIDEAEQIKDATGAEKKAHVLEIVKASVTVANATGKVKLDPAAVHAVASKGIDSVVGAIDIIEGEKTAKK